MDENVDVRSLPIVMEQYEELNYEIHMTDSKTKNCLICFSGHGLYFPNTLETFENRIIDNNRFEWKKVNQNKNSIELVFSQDSSAKINGEKIFVDAFNISRMFRFQMKNNCLIVILDTIKLDEHYVFLLTKLLDKVEFK